FNNEEPQQLPVPPGPPPPAQSRKPGWDIVLAPIKAPKDISSAVDPSNILTTKRCANLAVLRDLSGLNEDHFDLPPGPVAFVLAQIPQTYNQAMASG
ncbi:hypothetical protein VP01_7247g1, partial [Puccinia sorghi]